MENQKYLNEEKYQEINGKIKVISKVLLITGIIVLVIGVICIIISMTNNSSMNAFNSFTSSIKDSYNSMDDDKLIGSFQESVNESNKSFNTFTIGAIMSFLGFCLTCAGVCLTFISHKREITAYTAQQMIPVKKEIIEEVTPTIGNAAGTIAKNISQGIKEGLKDNDNN